MSVSSSHFRLSAAFLTAAAGIINILSALYPAIPSRMEILRDLLPLHFIRSAQTATVIVGFFLILLADGLRKRRQRAMQATVVLLIASTILNLTKGLDFEEATYAAILAIGLVVGRKTFSIASRTPAPRRLLQQVSTFALLYYCYVLLGFLLLRGSIAPVPTFWNVVLEPLRLLVDSPIYHYASPQARWFGRSVAVLGSAALLYSGFELLRPLIPRRRPTPGQVEQVRSLVQRYGSDTLSYFLLQDGRSYFFDASTTCVLSYRLWGTVALVGGDPVGAPHHIPGLIGDFLRYNHEHGIEPCFLGVSHDQIPLYRALGLRTLKIGEEALIDLPDFDPSSLKRKVRRAVRHVEESGISATTYRRDAIPASLLCQMERISREWVEAKGGFERGFSMTLGRLPRETDADCEFVVAVQGDQVWGYLAVVPVYQGAGWSLDAMRRRVDGPNGLTEFLIVKAAETFRDRGYELLSLNFATLSNSEDDIDSRAVEGVCRFLFEHLSSYYQLKSLYQFNSKFEPRWRSRYLAYRDTRKIPQLALAIVQLEDPIRLPIVGGVFNKHST